MVVLTLLVSSIGNISVSFTNNSINLRRLGFFVSIIYIYNLFCSGAYKVEPDYITNMYNYFGNIQANSKKIVKKTTMKSLGGKLKEIRELRGMTQSDLAQMFGIKSTRYANLENNVSKPSLEYLLEISRIFGIAAFTAVFVAVDHSLGFFPVTAISLIFYSSTNCKYTSASSSEAI